MEKISTTRASVCLAMATVALFLCQLSIVQESHNWGVNCSSGPHWNTRDSERRHHGVGNATQSHFNPMLLQHGAGCDSNSICQLQWRKRDTRNKRNTTSSEVWCDASP